MEFWGDFLSWILGFICFFFFVFLSLMTKQVGFRKTKSLTKMFKLKDRRGRGFLDYQQTQELLEELIMYLESEKVMCFYFFFHLILFFQILILFQKKNLNEKYQLEKFSCYFGNFYLPPPYFVTLFWKIFPKDVFLTLRGFSMVFKHVYCIF